MRHSLGDDITASAALFLYSVAVAAGFTRVFSGWDFFDNLVLVAFLGHAVALGLRRTRVPLWIAFPLTGACLIWLIGAMFYRDTYSLLMPTSETWELFRLELDVVGESFRTAVAPVPFLGGWEVLASLGLAAAVLLSDTFAFRAYARAEALVPGGVLFVFIAALGTDRSRIGSTAALVATGVIATIVLRQHHLPRRSTTVGRPRGMIARAAPLAVGSALSIAVIAGFLGPRLPGAEAEPIYETRGGRGGSVTNVVSPLVDIRSRLTNRRTTELFTVQANTESYWRSSALPEFDGAQWKLPERSLSRADGRIADGREGAVEISQQVTISSLGGPLVPAAADPVFAEGEGELRSALRWNADSATLVKTGADLEPGDRFVIVSASPRPSGATLAGATSLDPGDPIYLALPDDFPTAVRDIALEVTAGSTSTYEAALALQNWMRDENEFTYSLEVQEGHSNNAIESFLRNRIGYCEQFAGTYAAMMRSIGIPSRVAVGFTPGTDDGAGTYSVLGRNAHAWPEVWFDGFGWVPFEPTPNRGAPGAEGYTGVPPEQAEGPIGGDESAGDGAAPETTVPPATTVAPDDGAPTPTTVAGDLPAVDRPQQMPDDGFVAPVSDGSEVPWRLLTAIGVTALALVLPALIRRVRRSALSSPRAQLAHLWTRALDALGAMGLEASASRTPSETATQAGTVFPAASRPMQSLADVVTIVNFAPDGSDRLDEPGQYGVSVLENCSQWVRQVERAVTDSLGPAERVRRYFTHLN